MAQETRIKVQRPDGTIEIVTRPGTITDRKLREQMAEATRNAGKGEIIGWEIVGQPVRSTVADRRRTRAAIYGIEYGPNYRVNDSESSGTGREWR